MTIDNRTCRDFAVEWQNDARIEHADAVESVAKGDLAGAILFQEMARRAARNAQRSLTALLHRFPRDLSVGDHRRLDELLAYADDESANDVGLMHAVAVAARRSLKSGCDAQWWLDLIDGTDTPESVSFYRAVAHRLLSMEA